jgi:hypothetical protein
MVEAPKLKQLLKVAEVHNPNWYPFIYGYLKGELDSLELDNSEEENYPEQYTQELNMGNFDTCVVAEPFDFTSIYDHENKQTLEDHVSCVICESFAQKLYNNRGSAYDTTEGHVTTEEQRHNFADILKQFYEHMGYMK